MTENKKPAGHSSLNGEPHKVNLVISKNQIYVMTFADRNGAIILDTCGNDPEVTIRTDTGDGSNLEKYRFTHEV